MPARHLSRQPEVCSMPNNADDTAQAAPAVTPVGYVAPTVTVLGSLAELTLGGTDLPTSDGFGGAGDSGSI